MPLFKKKYVYNTQFLIHLEWNITKIKNVSLCRWL